MSLPDYGVLNGVCDRNLTFKIQSKSGRNSQGRITVRHQGGGNKKLYRLVDFVATDKLNVPARVETLEYDPYRTAFIMKLLYKDGERRYSLAPFGIKIGDKVITAESASFTVGNRMRLKNIPVGTQVYNVEVNPGKGGQLARSAGSYVEVQGHDAGYSHLKMASGEVRRVLSDGFATIGQVSNPDWQLVNIGKAGRVRGMGIRPTVRGTAMNPCDHPYGGGEGRQPRGTRKPKSFTGKVTGGRKTRNKKKWSNTLIVKRRVKKSRK
ncbi:MAG: 50S ribosomal protein L2 [Parcubacteria group bacterium]